MEEMVSDIYTPHRNQLAAGNQIEMIFLGSRSTAISFTRIIQRRKIAERIEISGNPVAAKGSIAVHLTTIRVSWNPSQNLSNLPSV